MTQIEWTDQTWNPVVGCSIVSPGCTNCYAMNMARRVELMTDGQNRNRAAYLKPLTNKYKGLTRQSGGRTVWTGEVRCIDSELEKPLHWKKPRMIFVNSMSDLFHEAVPIHFIEEIWKVMEATPQHTYQILTKRPQRMRDDIDWLNLPILDNVWLGVSVESFEYNYRIALLSDIPAAVRFVSFEPLLNFVGLPNLQKIDWAIVGGESGPNARLMNKYWVEQIQGICETDEVALFFKQWGGKNKKKAGRILNGHTYDEIPIIKQSAVVL